MGVLMVRSKVKPESVAAVEAAVEKVFSAIEQAQPGGVRYASCKLGDGVTFVALLELEEPGDGNPLLALPAFREFQEGLRDHIAEPPAQEQLQVVGSYRLFE
jgi:hypothetical protein